MDFLNKKGLLGVAKISLVLIAIISLVVFAVQFVVPVLANTHTADVTLDPKFTTCDVDDLEFTVNITHTSGDPIIEVRIYKTSAPPQNDFACGSAPKGWDLWEKTSYCQYETETDKIKDSSKAFTFSVDIEEESNYIWEVRTYDDVDSLNKYNLSYTVDCTAPTTRKHFEGPQKVEEGVEWIDDITQVVLEAEDDAEHNSSVDKTWYINILAEGEGELACWDPETYCHPPEIDYPSECIDWAQQHCEENWREGWNSWEECVEYWAYSECGLYWDGYHWNLYTDPFTKDEESCHVLYYFSVDNVGNVEDVKANCFFVDKTPPLVHKDNGEAIPGSGEGLVFHWITPNMPITFTCTDQRPHPSGDEELCFRVSYDLDADGFNTDVYCEKYGETMEGDFCCVDATPQNPFIFNFNEDEDSLHDLEYFCRDAVNKKSEPEIQYYKVDSTRPVIHKEMFGSYIDDDSCPPGLPGKTGDCYVADDDTSGVIITVEDPDPTGQGCNVGGVWCYYEVYWVEEDEVVVEGEFSDYAEIIFYEDSEHELYIYCEDALGNSVEDWETFLVDSTPPETWKEYGEPYYSEAPEWYQECSQELKHECKEECGGDPYCVAECVYEYVYDECGYYPEWINSSTSVTLTPKDDKVGVDETYYKNILVADWFCYEECVIPYYTEWYEEYCEYCYEYPEDPECLGWYEFCMEGSPWILYERPFYKDEESCHLIEYFSVDKLGNEEFVEWQCVFVDNTSPEIYKGVGKPNVPCGEGEECDYYVTQDTPIYLECEDPEPHPVDRETIWYRYYLCGEEPPEEWTEYPIDTVYFPEDSCHVLEYYCEDALGNAGEIQTEIDIVDTQSPIIEKTTVGPQVGDCPPEEGQDCYIQDGVTEIHINVYDPGPHPVNDVWCEYEVWWETSEADCEDAGGYYYEDGWCLIDYDDFSDYTEIIFYEDSTHELYIYCEDDLGNWVEDEETFFVDSTPPETHKEYGGPYKGIYVDGDPECVDEMAEYCEEGCEARPHCMEECIYELCGAYFREWISSETPIWLGWWDEKVGTAEVWYKDVVVPDEYCYESAYYCQPLENGDWQLYWEYGQGEPEPIYKEEESCHILEFYSVDRLGNEEKLNWQCFFVDNTPPESVKEHGEPLIPDEGFDWVTQETPIRLDCEDLGPHPVDQETLCYKVSLDVDLDGDGIPDDDGFMYITGDYCEEFGGRMADGWCCKYVEDEDYELHFLEDSYHDLEYFCVDHLGNAEEPHIQWYKVDSEPLETTKTYVGPHYVDERNGAEWIDGVTEIEMKAEDGGEIHAIGVDEIYWRNIVLYEEGEWYCEAYENCMKWDPSHPGEWQVYEGPFQKENESCHIIEYYSVDELGNEELINWQCVFVDKTPPIVSALEPSGPHIKCEPEEDCNYWIMDNETEITLSCYDPEPHPSGVQSVEYRWKLDNGNWTEWMEYEEPIIFEEDSVHYLEYRCTDNVEKLREGPGKVYRVDSTPPETEKWFEGPYYEEGGVEWIDGVTEIVLDAVDPDPTEEGCNVGVEKTWYINILAEGEGELACLEPEVYCEPICDSPYEEDAECVEGTQEYCSEFWEEEDWDSWEECIEEYVYEECEIDCNGEPWRLYTEPFTKEESCHILQYFSVDELGNEEGMQVNCFFVDKTPPYTEKWYEGPQYPEEIDEETEYPHWISSETEVILKAYDDDGQHESGVKATYWRNAIIVDDIYCEEPETYCEPIHDYEDGGWILYEGPFQKEEQSCHMIEYYSVDNVDKKEPIKAQCVFVDNSPPNPVKIVEEPKVPWDGIDSIFYPEIGELCWNGEGNEIECWKITTMTPISLDCENPEPHPVDDESLCFRIEVNGEDVTDKKWDSFDLFDGFGEGDSYCDYYGGEYNESGDGFCCIDGVIEDFLFKEKCEHNLEYYCVDGLGNKGSIDEEKFKVEGTAFEIPLEYKWNLISVPFVLLSSEPEEVFKDTDNVSSVWTYDSENDEWYYWSPGPAPDTLESIEPGWGYWVLTDDEDTLTIGGSLFSEGPVKGPDRELISGWNLIGYYGTQWELYPFFEPEYEYCGIPGEPMGDGDIEQYIYGGNAYCSLISLTNRNSGLPYWNMLEGHLNCGDGITFFYPISSCAKGFESETIFGRMYAGHGYWVHLPYIDGESVKYLYSPSMSNFCIWPFDVDQCVYPEPFD